MWITNRNMDQIRLVQAEQGCWQYVDGKGRIVRLSILVPDHFPTERAARDAAARVALSVNVDGKIVWGDERA